MSGLDQFWQRFALRVGDGNLADLGHEVGRIVGERSRGREIDRRDTIRRFVWEGMMNQKSHANLIFVDAVPQPLEKGVVIIKAGVNSLDGAKDSAFIRVRRVTPARAGRLVIQIVEKTPAVAVIQARAGELFSILHIRRAAEADLLCRIKRLQRINDRLLLIGGELCRIREQIANLRQRCLERSNVRRKLGEWSQAPGDLLAQGLAAGQRLIEKLIPQIKRERDSWWGVIGDFAPNHPVVRRLPSEIFGVRWDEIVRRRAETAIGGLHRKVQQRSGFEREKLAPQLRAQAIVHVQDFYFRAA